MTHPLIDQLRFTRAECARGLKGVSEEDGRRRFLPMNCLAWNVGHLAWQEQRYFLYYGSEGRLLLPEIDREFAYGAGQRAVADGDGGCLANDHRGGRPLVGHLYITDVGQYRHQ